MRYAQIRSMDISNSIGIGCSLFVQGCSLHCNNCFNKDTWNFEGGKEWTKDVEEEFINLCKEDYVDCISILGGEPFDQDDDLYNLMLKLIEIDKPIFIWSGHTFEWIISQELPRKILTLADYLIDGAYVDNLKDYKLKLRGSSNQRVIDVQKSLEENKIVLKEET